MADIKIISADPKSTDEKLMFTFSEVPSADWTKEFNEFWQKSGALQNLGLNRGVSGKILTITGQIHNAQQVLDEVNKVVAQTNADEDDFQNQLKNLKF